MLFMPAFHAVNSAFDLATLTFISALIFLSVVSVCFIFYLRLKSKSLKHLQNFNSLWTVRFLLVFFIFSWSLTELLRVPLFRRRFLPSTTVALCKIHIVLNLGFFQPAFLVTLVFLLNASIATTATKKHHLWTISTLLVTCILPITALQTILAFFNPLKRTLPGFLREPSVAVYDGFGSETVMCEYPLLSSIVFAGFVVAYSAWFLYSCWKVLSLVINKGLRVRIYVLAAALLMALPLQVVALGSSALWRPDKEVYGVVSLMAFLGAFCCAVTGQGVMVIKPISDALDAGGCCGWWGPRDGGKSSSFPPERVVGGQECV